MTSKSLSYNRFWAKASEPEDLYHLLPYHNLDVAAVGVALLSNDLALCSRLRGLVSPQLAENLVPFITLLLAWHDVGKFSDSFQNLRPDLMNRLQGKESQERYILRHDSAGWLWFRHKSTQVRALILEGSRPLFRGCRTSDDTLDVLDPILRAVFGHHGRPPDQIKALSLGSSLFPQDADLAAMSFIEDTAKLLCGCPISITSDESFSEDCRGANTTAWLVAGLAVMCDWIGSNSEYFPFHPDPMSLKEYWHNYARPRAEKAVHELGILPCKARLTR
jgi:CRISPR-associated endonuclease/helicase Cas3